MANTVRSVGKDPAPVVPADLGDLEREVLEAVWRLGETTVREVLGALNGSSGRQRAYTTVMTVLGNLYRKKLLTRRREGRSDVYAAVLDRDAYAQARARAEVGALVAEYGDVAYANFAREMARLDPERRERLRRLSERDD